ncbi:MAG TPA: hypothetical protein VME42_01460 [Steroidobacteraceae bacterium]|nr:hypothetical protein [Steroidobacteraceae bacterium]
MALASAASAAPPGRGEAMHRGNATPLDLRAPDEPPAATSADAAFPSAGRARPRAAKSVEDDLPLLGEHAPVHVMSRPEQIARRFRREGLPIARLWESHAALLSFGLNQRGKPGLWLIQKVP